MRTFLHWIIFIQSFFCSAQINYRAVFMDSCSDEATQVHYFLSDSLGFYQPNYLQNGVIELPVIGTYYLINSNLTMEGPIEIKLSSEEDRVDTFWVSALQFNQYIGYSDFTLCDSLANGFLRSYYLDGNLYLAGNFKNGQVLDSLFEYYPTGELREIYIKDQENWSRKIYYKSGHIESLYDTKKRFETTYYSNGQIKDSTFWNKKYHHESFSYYSNGSISEIQTKNRLTKFTEFGLITYDIIRDETAVLYRVFSNDNFYRTYDYKWSLFDTNGILWCRLFFSGYEFDDREFPERVRQIREDAFDQIILYQNGSEAIKIDFKYVEIEHQRLRRMIIYKKEGKNWVEKEIRETKEVYSFIESFQTGNN